MDMMLEQFKTIFDRPEKVKKLRETILNLAVRGKLVPQDSNDEPASILLERIKKEKERLIKEKRIKKEKPLAEISEDEKPFELPKGWEWARFSEIAYFNIGRTPSRKNSIFWDEEYFNWVSISDMKHNGYIESTKEMISRKAMEECFKGVFSPKGTLIMSFKLTIGKISILNIDAVHNEAIISIFPFEEDMKEYLFKGINGFDLTRGTNDAIMGKTLNSTSLKEIVIGIPPIEEQKRIVEKVDLLMGFCDKLEKSLEKKVHYGELSAKSVFNAVGNVDSIEELEEVLRFILLNFKDLSLGDNAVKELKNCILQLAVQGKLVPQDPNDEPAEILLAKIREEKERLIKEKKIKKEKSFVEISEEEQYFKIPNGWGWVRLGQLFNIVRGSSPRPKGDPRYFTNTKTEYHWVTIKDISNSKVADKVLDTIEYLTYEGSLKSRYVEKDEIIIAVSGSVGKSAIMGVDGYIYDGLAAMKFVVKNIVLRNYIYNYFKGWKEKINDMSEGTSMPNINIDKLNMLVIPLPPLEEQKRIIEKIDSLMKLCDELQKKIEKQGNYSNRLMKSILKSSLPG